MIMMQDFLFQHKEGNSIDLSDGFKVTPLGNGILPQVGTSLAAGDQGCAGESLQ